MKISNMTHGQNVIIQLSWINPTYTVGLQVKCKREESECVNVRESESES